MIDVESDVTAESGSARIRFAGSGSTLTAYLDGPFDAIRLLRQARSAVPAARAVVPLLVRVGVTIDVVVGKLRVARAGAGVEANLLARVLQVAYVHIGR